LSSRLFAFALRGEVRQQLALAADSGRERRNAARRTKPNMAPLLDHLMEPIARKARQRALEALHQQR